MEGSFSPSGDEHGDDLLEHTQESWKFHCGKGVQQFPACSGIRGIRMASDMSIYQIPARGIQFPTGQYSEHFLNFWWDMGRQEDCLADGLSNGPIISVNMDDEA